MVYCERCGVNCFLVLRSELRKGYSPGNSAGMNANNGLQSYDGLASGSASFVTPYACHSREVRHPFVDLKDVALDNGKLNTLSRVSARYICSCCFVRRTNYYCTRIPRR